MRFALRATPAAVTSLLTQDNPHGQRFAFFFAFFFGLFFVRDFS